MEEIGELASALAPCARYSSIDLALGAPVWLPPRGPRALAVEVHDSSGDLEHMQRELSDALARLSDWEPERRRFRAHITVARVRGAGARAAGRHGHRAERGGGRAREGERGGGIELPVTPPLRFAPEAIALYRSRLLPEGAAYEALASCALAPACD